eukprot:9761226-Alexandrium_andersonii.AAC.1
MGLPHLSGRSRPPTSLPDAAPVSLVAAGADLPVSPLGANRGTVLLPADVFCQHSIPHPFPPQKSSDC